jgi:hypothetical protein
MPHDPKIISLSEGEAKVGEVLVTEQLKAAAIEGGVDHHVAFEPRQVIREDSSR